MTRSSFAPGKIILAGEYAVVFGKPGLAVPSGIGMRAIFEESLSTEVLTIEWPGISEQWKNYLGRIVAMCGEHKGDMFRGKLSIENDLPLGKGMGSSTACVVAVARALLGEGCQAAAQYIEDHANPGHSGLDFAVIWGNQPLRFRQGHAPEHMGVLPPLPFPILIDTGQPGETTAELVGWVREHQAELIEPIQTIGRCADRLLQGETALQVFRDHHRAQVALGVVPKHVQELITNIEDAGGAAKVIGAGAKTGGGGMVLAIHPSIMALRKCLPGDAVTMPM